MISSLRRAQPWALFLALYGFLCAALAGISAIYGWMQPDGRVLGALQWGLAMAWLLCAYPLFRFAQALRRIRPGAGAAPLEEALAQQRTFLRILAIALLAEAALVSLAVSVSLVRELAAPDVDVPPPLYASIARACDTQARELLCAAVAFYDREGVLAAWTGWHKFVPERPGTLELSSHPNNVDITYSGEGTNTWRFQVNPPPGKVLTLGEYTGAKSGSPGLEPTESGSLSVQTPPAWFPLESGAGETAQEWPGDCTSQIIYLERSGRRRGLRFNVRGIHWDRNGEIRQISLDFEQSCTTDDGTWLVLGRIRATNPD